MKKNFKSIVLLCSHNGEKFIEEQVKSVLNQTLQIDKLFVHDYNSRDRTRSIIRKIQLNDNRVILKVFNYSFNPCHSFLNSILLIRDSIKDDYVLSIIDQDDFWTIRKNEKVIKSFNEEKQIVFHDVFITNQYLEVKKNSYYNGFWNIIRDLKLPAQFFANCVIGHTISLTRDLLEKLDLEYNSAIPMHDWHIINQSLLMGCKITYLENQLSHYRQHGNNILGANSKRKNILKKLINHGKLLRKYHDFLKEKVGNGKRLNFSILQIIKTVRPTRKLILILITRIFFYRT